MNPLSAIFGAGVAFRNALYDRSFIKVNRLSHPVVSIGNISVGGAGKTPFVMALGEMLKERGIVFDVLSRGYRRNTRGIAVVDPAGSSEDFGDEPLLIARKLQAPVIVGRERYQAGLLAEQKLPSRLHLLDDGFQHRRLHRDFDIVMLPASDLQDALLPVGRLREPAASLGRADVVCMETDVTPPPWARETWRFRRELELDPPYNIRAIAFCGVARPKTFFNQIKLLEHAGGKILQEIAFSDHHRYSESDLRRLERIKTESGAEYFITTEKDEVNLGGRAGRLQPLRIARLRLRLEKPGHAIELLLRTLRERCGFSA